MCATTLTLNIKGINNPKFLQIDEILQILNTIKVAGNYFFKLGRYAEAGHKYNKASRYYTYYSKESLLSKDDKAHLDSFYLINCLNCAAVDLKLFNYSDAKSACNLVSLLLCQEYYQQQY